ncbi:TetR family transcriptional regulator [Acinetobacter qingfengensis]|uniref:TetR family transcriptional regulator n=1 Tax=Acinetobacter qingfengensis TaxID=1262585 RepID=A0A1E7R8Z6_9GAMM|nr:TetR family transcriptional regulator [Acinetobacter qingfengensis]KAA8735554.1 TetR family transcriptional regulator [Acinetobacter qingfengensis]OEY95798.1 TetR family transcriptional regulator [Acinetobacter qingfengensis]
MSYLNKQERRSQIIDYAKQIVLSDGLNALTVRHLSATAGISVGQVHHHFGSVSELKVEVFLALIKMNLETEDLKETGALTALANILGFVESSEQLTYLKLWNDAEQLIDSDVIFKCAYQQAILLWHESVKDVLDQGQLLGKFQFDTKQTDQIAWRLIAASCGLESLYNLDMPNMNTEFFYQHIHLFIQNEINVF